MNLSWQKPLLAGSNKFLASFISLWRPQAFLGYCTFFLLINMFFRVINALTWKQKNGNKKGKLHFFSKSFPFFSPIYVLSVFWYLLFSWGLSRESRCYKITTWYCRCCMSLLEVEKTLDQRFVNDKDNDVHWQKILETTLR